MDRSTGQPADTRPATDNPYETSSTSAGSSVGQEAFAKKLADLADPIQDGIRVRVVESDLLSPTSPGSNNGGPPRAPEFVDGPRFLNQKPDKSDHAEIWRSYVTEANKSDEALLKRWADGIDIFLLFTGLFSAILSAFLVLSWSSLQADPNSGTSEALVAISQQLVLLSSGQPMEASVAYQAPTFTPPYWAVTVNCLWFTGLFISLLTAVLAMMLKEWLSAYSDGAVHVPLERVKQRQMRYNGLIKWNVPLIVSLLPLAIHVAVFLFLVGLILFAWPVSETLSMLMSVLLAIGFCLYFISALLALYIPECPYRSPLVYLLDFLAYIMGGDKMATAEAAFLHAKGMLLQANALEWMALSPDPTMQERAMHFLSWWCPPLPIRTEFGTDLQRSIIRTISQRINSMSGNSVPVDDPEREQLYLLSTLVEGRLLAHELLYLHDAPERKDLLSQQIGLVRQAKADPDLSTLCQVLDARHSGRAALVNDVDKCGFSNTLYLQMERCLNLVHGAQISRNEHYYEVVMLDARRALADWTHLLDYSSVPPTFLTKYLSLLGHLLELHPAPCCKGPSDRWLDRYSTVVEAWMVANCLERLFDPGYQPSGFELPESTKVGFRKALLICLARNTHLIPAGFAHQDILAKLLELGQSAESRRRDEEAQIFRSIVGFLLPVASNADSRYGRSPDDLLEKVRVWLNTAPGSPSDSYGRTDDMILEGEESKSTKRNEDGFEVSPRAAAEHALALWKR